MKKNNKKRPGSLLQRLPLALRRNRPEPTPNQADSVRRWVESLPRVNAHETAQQLRHALEELNRVERTAEYRLDALDAMRPTVYIALRGLEKQYLGQPLSPDASAVEALRSCNDLNRLLFAGYWKVANALSEQSDINASPNLNGNPYEDSAVVTDQAEDDDEERQQSRQRLATAVHRAITEHSRLLFRRYQVYTEPSATQWKKLYQMFMYATRMQLAGAEVVDPVLGDGSLQHSFLRILLFAAAQPQRLIQADMARVFHFLSSREELVTLTGANASGASLMFRLTDGSAPTARSHMAQNKGCMGINTQQLCQQLQAMIDSPPADGEYPEGEKPLSAEILKQLQQCWQGELPSTALPTSPEKPTHLVLGLPASHFFAAGQTPFTAFTEQLRDSNGKNQPDKEIAVARPGGDVWATSSARDARIKEARPGRFAHQAFDFESPLSGVAEQSFPHYSVLSAQGEDLCVVHWRNQERVHPRIGNVVAVRALDAGNWSAGLLRAIRYQDSEKSILEVELLAENIQPFCSQILDAGLPVGRPQRVLLFSQGKDWQGGVTLLSGATDFTVGQSLRLTQPGQAPLRIRLNKELAATSASQFFSCEILRIEKRPLIEEAACQEASSPQGDQAVI